VNGDSRPAAGRMPGLDRQGRFSLPIKLLSIFPNSKWQLDTWKLTRGLHNDCVRRFRKKHQVRGEGFDYAATTRKATKEL